MSVGYAPSPPLVAHGDGVNRMPDAQGFGPGYVASLPTASAHWDGQFLRTAAGVSVCKTNGSGGWEWVLVDPLTQAEVDARVIAVGDPRYVNVAGDGMTGNLDVTKANPLFQLVSTSGAARYGAQANASTDRIEFAWMTRSPFIERWYQYIGSSAEDYGYNLWNPALGQHAFRFARSTNQAFFDSTTPPQVNGLAGTGTRVVEASSTGLLSASAPLGMVHIATAPFNGATGLNFNNVFTSTYKNYTIQVDITSVSGAAGQLYLRMRVGGVDNASNIYTWTVHHVHHNGPHGVAGSIAYNTAGRILSHQISPMLSPSVTVEMHCPQVAERTRWYSHGFNIAGDGSLWTDHLLMSAIDSSVQFDGCTIFSDGATIQGTASIYGWRTA